MNYLKFKKSISRASVALAAAFILMVIAVDLIYPKFFPSTLIFLAKPFWAAGNSLTAIIHSGFLSSRSSLMRENQELRDALLDARLQLLTLSAINKENAELKALLSRSAGENLLAASVLARPPFSPYDTFIIDVGSALGVRIGDLALAADHHLIGEVSEVGPNFAKVKLFSSPGSQVEIVIGDQGIETVAVGQGGGAFLTRLPKGVVVKVGDPVIFPSLHSRIYGFVESVEEAETDTFQNVYFRSPVNVAEINYIGLLHRTNWSKEKTEKITD
jgi:cell shape-determining protein MreC